ncbi:MAG: hypothetical protein FWF94_01585 [Oscillospiraceae bacterium]|nr:hypothetical protein [Oscillospiraceae bacterium]
MKDYWGNPALDFGDFEGLMKKYTDKIFVSVSNKPFGDEYVLFVCGEDENEKAEKYVKEYDEMMERKGIMPYDARVNFGDMLLSKKTNGFQGVFL